LIVFGLEDEFRLKDNFYIKGKFIFTALFFYMFVCSQIWNANY